MTGKHSWKKTNKILHSDRLYLSRNHRQESKEDISFGRNLQSSFCYRDKIQSEDRRFFCRRNKHKWDIECWDSQNMLGMNSGNANKLELLKYHNTSPHTCIQNYSRTKGNKFCDITMLDFVVVVTYHYQDCGNGFSRRKSNHSHKHQYIVCRSNDKSGKEQFQHQKNQHHNHKPTFIKKSK